MKNKKGQMLLISLAIIGILIASVGLFLYLNNDKEENIISNMEKYQIAQGINIPAITFNNITLVDRTILNSTANTCRGSNLGMSIDIYPCIAADIDVKEIQQKVDFTWNGTSAQNTSWIFVYDGQLQSGKLEALLNVSVSSIQNVSHNQFISGFIVRNITSTANFGTPDSRCQVGNQNNTQMYNVTRNVNGTAFSQFYCFTSANVLNATTYSLFGNADIYTMTNVSSIARKYVDVTNQLQFLGFGLLGDNRSYYRIQDTTFQPNQKIETLWTYTPRTNERTGKWHILGYNTNQGLTTSITTGNYIYLDPFWNANWLNRKPLNITGGIGTLINFTAYVNVTFESGDMQTDFDDIRFVNGACSGAQTDELKYERDYKIDSNSAGFWVKIPSFTTGVNEFCMYYNNAIAVNGSDSINAWDDNYTIIMHMSEDTGSYLKNSKDGNNTFMALTGSPTWTTGKFGQAINLSTSGANRYAQATGASIFPSITNDFSAEYWLYTYGTGLKWHLSKMSSRASNNFGFDMGVGGDYQEKGCYWGSATFNFKGTSTDDVGSWVSQSCAVVDVTNAGSMILAKNKITALGAVEGAAVAGTLYQGDWALGYFDGSTKFGNSNYDEVRVSNIARSSDWLNRSYDNINMALFTFGAEEGANGVQTTLNSPANNYFSNNNFMVFNVTSSTVGTSILNNVTIFVWNSSNSLNWSSTTPLSGTLATTLFTQTFAFGNYTWTALTVGDSGAVSNLAANRSFSIFDTINPQIQFISPTPVNEANITSGSFKVNVTATDVNLQNVTFNLYNSTANINTTTFGLAQSVNTLCYQETANISTACGGSSNGSYNFVESGGTWANRIAFYDGDYETSTLITGGTAGVFINYSKPVGAINNSHWQIKYDSPPGALNLTIPSACWNTYNDTLVLQWLYNSSSGGQFWNCFDGINYQTIFSVNIFSVYEEGMYWNLTNYEITYFNLSDGRYSYQVNATDSSNNKNATEVRFVNLDSSVENLNTFNTTTFETAYEGFTSNVSLFAFNISSANLIYNGTSYAGTVTTSGVESILTRNIDIPTGRYGNLSWFWSLNSLSSPQLNLTTNYQNVSAINFTICKVPPQNVPYVNFTFINETTLQERVSSTFNSIWNYYLGSGTVNKTLTYINTTQSFSYGFCSSPPSRTLYANPGTIIYSNSESQQRSTTLGILTLTNSTTNIVLSLLPTSLGQYVTFQVINPAGQSLDGAIVNISSSTFGQGEVRSTDGSGGATFFLNPLVPYLITVSKSGYATSISTITPTQTSYTIQLGGSSSNVSVNDYTKGITTTIKPTPGQLQNNTIYNFNFTIVSTFWNLDSFGFVLKNSSGATLTSQSSTGATGGIVSANVDTANNSLITMNYFWVINGTYSNSSVFWNVLNDVDTQYSIKTLFTDLKSYTASGLFGLTGFGLALIVFLCIFMITGIASYKFGITSPAAIMVIIFGLTAFFDVGLDLIPVTVANIPHFATAFIGLIMIAVFFIEGSR